MLPSFAHINFFDASHTFACTPRYTPCRPARPLTRQRNGHQLWVTSGCLRTTRRHLSAGPRPGPRALFTPIGTSQARRPSSSKSKAMTRTDQRICASSCRATRAWHHRALGGVELDGAYGIYSIVSITAKDVTDIDASAKAMVETITDVDASARART